MSTEATQEARPRPPHGRPIAEIVTDLSKPVPAKFIKQRKQGGNTLDYITWYDATRILDYYAPGWSYEVRSVTQINGHLVVVARISIPCEEGDVWREATGIEEEDMKGYGDVASNAEAMALKRSAAKFGLARHLYEK